METYKASIPNGKSGPWEVQKFRLTKERLSTEILRDFQTAASVGEDRSARPGWYTKLSRDGHVVMSDTPAELKDLNELDQKATGDVLIHGLGLGIAAELCLRNPKVKSVHVIEQSLDVITLSGPTLQKRWGKKLTLFYGDAYSWRPPGIRFDVVWSDIWDTITTDNLPEMERLRKLWIRRTKWHGFWCKTQCARMEEVSKAFSRILSPENLLGAWPTRAGKIRL